MAGSHRALAVTLLALTSGCVGSLCANSVTERVSAPDGKHDAVVFTRDCGATTGFSTQIAIVNAKADVPNDAGNVFVAPDESVVRIAWAGPDTLIVQHAVPRPNLAVSEVEGVTVRYAVVP